MEKNNTVFICPVCHDTLISENNSVHCVKGHSFDRSSLGYLNLLRSNVSSARNHGDDKEMINARKRFLDGGYYSKMRDSLCNAISAYTNPDDIILDAGCGEGYYTSKISEIRSVAAVDISKNAVASACKRTKNADFAVASVYDLPLKDKSVNAVVSVFSPFALSEFRRILCENGLIFSVIPLSRHLFGLKSVIYDTPYENEVQSTAIDGFTLIYEENIVYSFSMQNNQIISDLFTMTPYYYRTPQRFSQRLENISSLTDEAQFKLLVYRMN